MAAQGRMQRMDAVGSAATNLAPVYTLIKVTQGLVVLSIVLCLFIPPLFPFALLLGVLMIVLTLAEGRSAKGRVANLPPFAAWLEQQFIAGENAGQAWVDVSVTDLLKHIPGNRDAETAAQCRLAMESRILNGDQVLTNAEGDVYGFKVRFVLPRRPMLRQRPPA